ncbi:MAG: hypothetical protein WAV05_07810, partial [Anaerolineales bacterium]
MNAKQPTAGICFFIVGLLAIGTGISSCGPGQLLGPTLTPTPTNTPVPTNTATATNTATPTNTPLPTSTPIPPTATPKTFAIQDSNFEADYKGDCETD